MHEPTRVAKVITEAVGTFFLVLIIMLTPNAVALGPVAVGLGLTALVYMGGPISKAQYNPAVSLVFWRHRTIDLGTFWWFVLAQFVGASVGAIVGDGLLPLQEPTGRIDPISTDILVRMTAAEVLFTWFMVLVILNVATHPKAAGNQYYGVAIGLAVAAGALVAGPISGAALNPAVGLALAISGRGPAGLEPALMPVVYLLGPVIGALTALATYRLQCVTAQA
jgi:glycerol uptake facilitator-like aquaporin